MKKEFFVNILLLILVNALVKPAYLFGVDRQVQVLVGTEAFGYYANLFNFTLILQFVNDFGLQPLMNRMAGQDPDRARASYREVMGLRMILAAVYLLVTLLFAWLWFGPDMSTGLLLRLAVNQILISTILFLRASISGLGLYRTDSLLSVLDRLFLLLVCPAFLYAEALKPYVTISWFVDMQTLSLILCVLVCFGILVRHRFHFRPLVPGWQKGREILRAGFPFAMVYLTYAALTKSDSIWLVRLLENGSEKAGEFTASMRLYEAASMISLAFATLLMSMFSRNHRDPEKIMVLLKSSLALLLLISVSLSGTVFFLSERINHFLYPAATAEWNQLLSLVMFGFIPASINFIFGAYFQALQRERELWWMYGSMLVLSVILNLIFVPTYQALGSACIFGGLQLILLIVQVVKSGLNHRDFNALIRSSLVFCLSLGSLTLISVGFSGWSDWSRVIVFLAIVLVMALVSGLFKISDWNGMVKLIGKKNGPEH